MSVSIVGLDLSLTATGVSSPSGEFTVTTNAAWPIEHRLINIREAVRRHVDGALDDRPGSLVVIEDFVTRSPAASTLGMVHGVVRVALTEASIPFVLVPPATLKKYITGKGNAKKDDMRMAVYQRYGLDFADNNQCDAFGLRAMGMDAFGDPLAVLPAAQRASLEKIAWPLPVVAS